MRLALTLFLIMGCHVLLSCMSPPVIQDKKIDDRVIACGAGFSDDSKSSLIAAYYKNSHSGEISVNFKEEARAVIFDKMPAQSQLKSYEDYIQCIEKNWN